MSLEEEVDLMWTFYSAGSQTKYSVSRSAAKLSGLFKGMIENSNEETEVSLQPTEQPHENKPIVYVINTDEMLAHVYDYMMLWADEPEKADYVPQAPVQTSEISHILKDKDIAYIRNFLRGARTDREVIERLGGLLCQVDEFLQIDSLSNKIYAYIAVLVWNKSSVDFAEALEDPEFEAAQLKAVEEWKKDNPGKFADYVEAKGLTAITPRVPATAVDLDEVETLADVTESEDSDEDESDDSDV